MEGSNIKIEIPDDVLMKIVDSIDAILLSAQSDLANIDKLLDIEFAKGRKTQLMTALVYSAFKPGTTDLGKMQIRKIPYGKGLYEPELFLPDKLVIQLYSSKTYLDSKEIIHKIQKYGCKFCCLQFDIEDYILQKITRVDFNQALKDGKPVIRSRNIEWTRKRKEDVYHE